MNTSRTNLPLGTEPARTGGPVSSSASEESADAAAAARARVTAQELAQALAALETRDAADQDKVAIGEALQQLGVGVDAREVWAQVRAQREQNEQREQQARAEAQKRQHHRTGKRAAAVSAAAAGLTVFYLSLGLFGLRSSTSTIPPPATLAPATVAPAALAPAALAPATAATPAGLLRTWAEVAEGQTVEATPEVLKRFLRGERQESASLVVRDLGAQPRRADAWLLTKHGGAAYVRGYTAPASARVLSRGPVRLYSFRFDETGTGGGLAHVKPLTLRVGSFTVEDSGSGSGLSSLAVSGIRLDGHADEKPEL